MFQRLLRLSQVLAVGSLLAASPAILEAAQVPSDAASSISSATATVAVSPQNPCIAPSAQLRFAATVTGNTDKTVKWYADGVLNGNSTVGTISAWGLYTAPASGGTHAIKAVNSQGSGTTSAKVGGGTVSMYPGSATVAPKAQQDFSVETCGAMDPNNASWSVDNIAGGNASVGTVSSSGLYTAPSTAGTHTVRAYDSTMKQTAMGTVSVESATSSGVSVDFGSRTNHNHPIPADIFGANRVQSLHGNSDLQLLRAAGVTHARTYTLQWLTYANGQSSPNWTRIDGDMRILRTGGFHPIMEVAYSAPWEQPKPNPCGTGQYEVAPTSLSAWAQVAASYVAHFDANFPGLVQDYEIWNEPNTSALCGTQDKLNTYLAIYSAAAKAMKAQAAKDGVQIRVGGPATAGYQGTWIQALTTNATTAPYVDFVSYHEYIGSNKDLQSQWDTTYNGQASWLSRTQGSSGPAAWYRAASGVVRAGKTPLGAKTPIYIDEYNLDWAFAKDCCRNDPTYSPIWNTMYVADVLNTVYQGASQVPSKLTYFAATTGTYTAATRHQWYFCMIGGDLNTGDPTTERDCYYPQNTTPELYPQYFAYQLMGSANYLGLASGGYMAASVSPYGGTGIQATAFYNGSQDSLLIVNPSSSNYASVKVTLSNTGFSSPTATLYHIVNGASISSSTISLTHGTGTSYSVTIPVSAYSVQGIRLK